MNKIYVQKLGWIVSSHKKKATTNQWQSTWDIIHTQCCTSSSATLKRTFNIKIVFSWTNQLHDSFLHQIKKKKTTKNIPCKRQHRKSSASYTLPHHTQEEDRNKNCRVKGLYLHVQTTDPWTQLSKISLLWKLSVVCVFKQKDLWNLGVCLIMGNV